MKLFAHSQGYIFAFGFDMVERKPAPNMIGWCDPSTQEWDCKTSNHAGHIVAPFVIAPEFIREIGGNVVAYQPGRCVELIYYGFPTIWSLRVLEADPAQFTRPIAA